MSKSILFLCPHNAAKSVMAQAYFRKLVLQKGLAITAASAGTEPAQAVSAKVVELMKTEGIDVAGHQPRLVTPADVNAAWKVISLGCDISHFNTSTENIVHWDDIPAPAVDLVGARDTIRAHVEKLVNELDGVVA